MTVTQKKTVITLIIVLSLILLIPGCNNGQDAPAGNTGGSGSVSNPNNPNQPVVTGNVVKFKTMSVVDTQGIGTEAFSLLMPTDWQFDGGIKWALDNQFMPATSNIRVSNPKSKEAFELFPNQAFFWTDNQMTSQLFPVGTKYFGNEVHSMVSVGQALKEIVIPRFRPNVTGLKVISEGAVNDQVKTAQQSEPLRTSHETAKIRVEYTDAGIAYEDEIYCSVDAMYIPIQGMFGTTTNTNWWVSNIASFRAEQGKLDASAKVFQTISRSLKLNVKWFNKYNQVVEYLIKQQIQQIKSVGELSRIISQTSDQISSDNQKAWEERQARSDAEAENFSNYIRGVDNYFDPIKGETVELPSGYDNVWTNPNGEYVMAESPSFNPNVGSNLNWQPIKKQ